MSLENCPQHPLCLFILALRLGGIVCLFSASLRCTTETFVWVTCKSLNALCVTFFYYHAESSGLRSMWVCVNHRRSRPPLWWSYRDWGWLCTRVFMGQGILLHFVFLCILSFLCFFLFYRTSPLIPSNPSSLAIIQYPYLVGVPSISIDTSHAKQLWRTACIFSGIVRAPGGCG